jgi:hypothetical protein
MLARNAVATSVFMGWILRGTTARKLTGMAAFLDVRL